MVDQEDLELQEILAQRNLEIMVQVEVLLMGILLLLQLL